MSDKLSWQKITLQLRNPFRLSYGTSETRQAFWIRLKDDEGWGEGTIPPYYGVDFDEMISVWQSAANNPNPFPNEPQAIPAWIGDGPAPARCGLDIALHDRIARKLSLPLHKLLNVPFPKPKPSSFTIALDTPLEMARMADQVKSYPIIKVKLGGDSQDLERLAAIREVRPGVKLWVDANGGWTLDEAEQYLPELETLGIEMLEQPGLSPALKMIRQAKALDLKVLLGCMIETAIGTTAMAHLMGLGDWLDLDASALIVNDPFVGMTLDSSCKIQLPEGSGLGVKIRDQDRFF